MNYLGIEYNIKNLPVYDEEFVPYEVWSKEYLKGAEHPISLAIEREEGKVSVFNSFIHSEDGEADYRYVERFVKLMLWCVGGWKVYVCGCDKIADRLKDEYRHGGKREFDVKFMEDVFERPFVMTECTREDFPASREATKSVGGHLEGCRIGFDAGGSDRKVSAVIDGETVYSEEVVWFPKESTDLSYQFNGIVDAFKTAASKMPRVDAIGVSSAGVFVGNSPMVSSLFIKIPRSEREQVKTVFDRAAKEIGDGNVPIIVANDGDVTALAGAMSLNTGSVLGIAMGTSEAGGYVDKNRNLLGWFNELAFAPVDLCDDALMDEWSGDIGVGCKYFSQDAVIKLAPKAGIELDESLSLAEKLKVVQKLCEEGHEGAENIFMSIGAYLAHTVPMYGAIYDTKILLVLGRVASGKGGELLIAECNRILSEEYPELAAKMTITLPDEQARRVGQSIAAASLPEA